MESRRGNERTLTELVTPRIANDAGVAQSVVGSSGEDSLAIIAVVANEMGRSVVARALLEQARRRRRRVEEPLLEM